MRKILLKCLDFTNLEIVSHWLENVKDVKGSVGKVFLFICDTNHFPYFLCNCNWLSSRFFKVAKY